MNSYQLVMLAFAFVMVFLLAGSMLAERWNSLIPIWRSNYLGIVFISAVMAAHLLYEAIAVSH